MMKFNLDIVLDSVNGEVGIAEIAKRLSDTGLEVKIIPAADNSSDIWLVSRRKRSPELM